MKKMTQGNPFIGEDFIGKIKQINNTLWQKEMRNQEFFNVAT